MNGFKTRVIGRVRERTPLVLEPLEQRLMLSADHLAFTLGVPQTGTAGTALTEVDVTVEDASNAVVLGNTDNILLSDSSTTLTVNGVAPTDLAAVNGVATFDVANSTALAITAAGLDTLTATDDTEPLVTAANGNVTIDPAVPDHMSFTTTPPSGSIAAGTNNLGTMTVTLYDTYGNVETGDNTSTVTLTDNLADMTGGGGATTTAGVATWTVQDTTPDLPDFLSATDGGDSLLAIDSSASKFTIVPGAPAYMTLSTPPSGSIAAGTNNLGSLTATLKDAFGNVETGDNSSQVTLSDNLADMTGGGTLTVTGGVATFGTLQDTVAAGSDFLSVSDTDLGVGSLDTSGTPFTITPAGVDHMAFTSTPPSGNIAAGTNNLGTINVTLYDVYGNVETGDNTSSVTLADNLSDMTGGGPATTTAGVATWTGQDTMAAGSDYLTATDGGDSITPIDSSSTPFTIVGAAPAYMSFTSTPSGNIVAGTNNLGTITVTLYDTYGNVETLDNSSHVTLADNLTDMTGGGLATTTAGVATWTVQDTTAAGPDYLTATDSGDSLTAIDSSASKFTITPAVASQLVFTAQPTSGTAGTPLGEVDVSIEDQYGNVETSDSSTVSLTDSSGTLVGSPVSKAAVSGVAKFTGDLTVTMAGSDTLSATDLTDGLDPFTSAPITIDPGAVASMSFTSTLPSGNIAAGTNNLGTMTVTLRDSDGNIETLDNTSSVTLADHLADMTGGGPATTTAGVATWTIQDTVAAGSDYLTATDSGDSIAAINSSGTPFTITVGAANKLVFTAQPPSTATAGTAISEVDVKIEDQYGNVETADNSTVKMTDSRGGLAGTPVSVTAASGVAKFIGLTLDKSGTDNLVAGDTADSLSGFLSSGITVSDAGPYQLVFTKQPTNAAVNQPLAEVDVSIEDQYGNVVTEDTHSVWMGDDTGTLTINGNPSNLVTPYKVYAVAGVATFSVADSTGIVISQTGLDHLYVTQPTYSLGPVESAGFTVTAATPSKLVFSVVPNGTAGQALLSVQVTIEDQYGDVETGDSSSTVTLTDSSGTLIGTTGVKAVGGIATFTNLKVTKAGTDYLIGADSADSLSGFDSNNFTIHPSTPFKLVYTTQPVSSAAGVPLPNVVVTIEDQYGNVETSDSSQVSVTDYLGKLAGSPVSVAAVNGVATFSGDLTVNQAGTDQLYATDSTDSIGKTNSNFFTLGNGSATQLVFSTEPTDSVAGSPISPTVTVSVEYADGLVVGTDSSTVTLTDLTGTGSFAGTVSAVAVNGVAMFTVLNVTLVGSDTLMAADAELGALYSTSSNSFNISVGAPAQLAFIEQPTHGNGNQSLSPVEVALEDQYGNIETGVSAWTYNPWPTIAVVVWDSSGTLSGGNGGWNPIQSGIATYTGFQVSKGGSDTLYAEMDYGGNPYWPANTTGQGAPSSPTNTVTGSYASAPIEINAAASMTFTTEPGPTYSAGQTLSTVKVTIYDQDSNVATFDNTTVTLTDESGTLNGTTSVAAVNGIATFTNVKVTKAGSDYLIGADSADGFSGVDSTGFTVTPGPAFTLVYIQQPTDAMQGQTIAPAVQVEVEDQYGNVETSDNSSSISLTDDSATLAGGGAVLTTAGVATFSGLSVPSPFTGTDHLSATDSTDFLSGYLSTPFNISGAPAVLLFVPQPTDTTAGAPMNVEIDIEDSSGQVVTSDNSTVTLTDLTSSGSFAGTVSVDAVNGVATFTGLDVTLATASDTLTATDSADALTNTSNSFAVSPAAPSQLLFTMQPTGPVVAGAALNEVQVTIEDAYGNIETGDTHSVWLGDDTGTLTIDGNPTNLTTPYKVFAVAGVATFDVADSTGLAATTVGLDHLYATHPTYSLNTPVESAGFEVTVAAPAQLVFTTQPAGPVVAGDTINEVQVTIEDQYGNVETSDTNAVGLTDTGGTLTGTTPVAAVGGVATFSDLAATKAGRDHLIAADSTDSLGGYRSNGFNITPAAPAELIFSQEPGNAAAAKAMAPIQVSVADEYGNAETGDTSSITLGIATGPLGGVLAGTATRAAVGGTATFTGLSIAKAGVYTLQASDSADGFSGVLSNTFTISATSSLKLAWTTEPATPQSDGTILPVAVTIENKSLGNSPETGDDSAVSVRLSSNSVSGTTSVTVVNGVATFSNLVISKPGTYTLIATDTIDGLAAASSTSFVITIGTPAKLVFTREPATTTAGNTMAEVQVTIEDQYGNVETKDTNPITIGIATGPLGGTLSGSTTVPPVNGVASFYTHVVGVNHYVGFVITEAGSYTLSASDSSDGLSGFHSTSFTINAAAAHALNFILQPTMEPGPYPPNVETSMVAGPLGKVEVAVVDKYGNYLTTGASSVKLTLSSGGTLGGTTTTATVFGIATFSNLTVTTAGTFILNASDTSYASLGTTPSNPFIITAGAVNKLAFTTQPAKTTAGTTMEPVIVKIEDQYGNVETTDDHSISLALSTPSLLSGTTTVAAVNGVATYSELLISTAGNYTLKATDTADGNIKQTSSSFIISPAAPEQLVFTAQPPASSPAGTIATVKVTIEDQYGNTETTGNTGATDSVKLTLNTGTLIGTATVTAVSGVATFSGLAIHTAGSYTFTANDAARTLTANSNAFNITAAAANKLVFDTQPVDSGSSSRVATTTVDIEDQYGNLETSNVSHVTVVLAAGPGTLAGTTNVAAAGGVATFSTLVVSENGTYQLKATDGVLASALSLTWVESSDPPPFGMFAQLGGGLLNLDGSGDLAA